MPGTSGQGVGVGAVEPSDRERGFAVDSSMKSRPSQGSAYGVGRPTGGGTVGGPNGAAGAGIS